MSWLLAGQIWLGIGVATSATYLFNHYLPNLKKIKQEMKDKGIDVSDVQIFKPYQIIAHSISILTIFSLISPLLTLGLLKPGLIDKTNKEKIMEKAYEG